LEEGKYEMIIQNHGGKRIEVKYRVLPLCDGRPAIDGAAITDFEVQRVVKTYPVSQGGSVRWSRGEDYEGDPFTVPVGEVSLLIGELSGWLAELLESAQRRIESTDDALLIVSKQKK
jgi:hypothetical protein